MELLDRFRAAIRIKTAWPSGGPGGVSTPRGDAQAEAPLNRFQDFLEEAYPRFHRAAERFRISPYSLVYRWPGSTPAGGSDGGKTGAPVLILAHYDVVPVEEDQWTLSPFDAEIRDGYVYGRGTIDMKSILIAIMEGAETLCGQGFTPREDVWFAFGGDEERTGLWGARETCQWFVRRGLRFAWTLDEGSYVCENFMPGIAEPLALLGIEEKGYLSLELSVRQRPGHASRPPKVQAAAVLARALLRIARRPFPFVLTPAVESFFSGLAEKAPKHLAPFMRHARLLRPLFFRIAASTAELVPLIRPTVAMTQLEGSAADNVLPSVVRAVINLRLLPPWTVEGALNFIKKAVGDERVEIGVYGEGNNPVPASAAQSRRAGPGWAELEQAIGAAYPGVPVLPFIMTAATDSRHYRDLAGSIFRFSPLRLPPSEIALMHGHDERISIENLHRVVQFYTSLLSSL
ncbi:MAG: M20/M25/M40 family metallo-hydrolase [Spirochaetaceae bacterium]|jgi:carboxypeptidase PM20D1|nr:M20/M25/M40 family metallo-hydrolase [Spirochaetaceae bacterium]